MGKIIFITGTDTGVGKTVMTALLLHHLRRENIRALAMKPFCTGDLKDVEFLQKLQPGELSNSEMNPYFFPEPIAPFIAAQLHKKKIELREVLGKIFEVKKRCDVLLVEGAGGLLVPVGKDFTIQDLICALDCSVVLVSADRLGTINHTLLSVESAQVADFQKLAVVMMGQEKPDFAAQFNMSFLKRRLGKIPFLCLPYLAEISQSAGAFEKNCKKLQKTLARFVKCI